MSSCRLDIMYIQVYEYVSVDAKWCTVASFWCDPRVMRLFGYLAWVSVVTCVHYFTVQTYIGWYKTVETGKRLHCYVYLLVNTCKI